MVTKILLFKKGDENDDFSRTQTKHFTTIFIRNFSKDEVRDIDNPIRGIDTASIFHTEDYDLFTEKLTKNLKKLEHEHGKILSVSVTPLVQHSEYTKPDALDVTAFLVTVVLGSN